MQYSLKIINIIIIHVVLPKIRPIDGYCHLLLGDIYDYDQHFMHV